MTATTGFHRAPASLISPIHMERVAANVRLSDNPRRALMEAGATEELLTYLIVAVPGRTLGDYRFAFCGAEVSARLGRELSGLSFNDLLRDDLCLTPCLYEYEKAVMSGDKIVSRYRYDFSVKWVIEFSRVIYPVTAEDGSICAIGHYLFHDQMLEGRYF